MNRTEFIGLDLYYSEDFVEDMKNNYNQEIERLNKDLDTSIEICNNRQKEIVRLNNVINELEKYIGQEYYCFDNESVEFEITKNILNKLRELKENE